MYDMISKCQQRLQHYFHFGLLVLIGCTILEAAYYSMNFPGMFCA